MHALRNNLQVATNQAEENFWMPKEKTSMHTFNK